MKKNNRIVAVGSVGVLLLAALYFALTSRGIVQYDSNYRVIMGTFSRVVVIAETDKVAADDAEAAFAEQRRVDSLMSTYKEDSEISRVNRQAYDRPVHVSEATFEVVRQAVHFSELSDGAFDVTVGPLVDLWHAAAEANQPPTEAALAEARSRVGYDKLILDEDAQTIRFAVKGMKIDLGGIAKGYAIDKSIEALKQGGAVGGMVDIGGDVRCFGKPPRGQASWLIGLQDPNVAPDDLSSGKPLLVLKIADEAVTTSGGYRRFTVAGGDRESHILDTHTGHGADQLASVTIIAPDAITADALATTVSVLGAEKGFALIERLDGIEAILIPSGPDAKPTYSGGAVAYVK
jgi:thiamine biosynthesis lipoprotein